MVNVYKWMCFDFLPLSVLLRADIKDWAKAEGIILISTFLRNDDSHVVVAYDDGMKLITMLKCKWSDLQINWIDLTGDDNVITKRFLQNSNSISSLVNNGCIME